MSDDRSWYTSEYPDLRDGPPWVMQEMIEGQRASPPQSSTRPRPEWPRQSGNPRRRGRRSCRS